MLIFVPLMIIVTSVPTVSMKPQVWNGIDANVKKIVTVGCVERKIKSSPEPIIKPFITRNNMGVYQDLLAGGYLDATYGVVSNVSNGGCDNYHLFSSEAVLIAGWDLWPQYATFYKGCEVEPGLIKRYPGRVNGGISQDEMIGAATLDTNAAERIYEYGKTHWWYFNPDASPWSLSNWFGRFLDFPPYLQFRATGRMSIFGQICWSIMTFISPISNPSNTSGKLLKWVQIKKMEGHFWLCDLSIKWWKNRMKAQYPGGLQQVMQIYFGPTHPLAENAGVDF